LGEPEFRSIGATHLKHAACFSDGGDIETVEHILSRPQTSYGLTIVAQVGRNGIRKCCLIHMTTDIACDYVDKTVPITALSPLYQCDPSVIFRKIVLANPMSSGTLALWGSLANNN
jgi:hypothetical protein